MKMRGTYTECLMIDQLGFVGSFYSPIDDMYWDLYPKNKARINIKATKNNNLYLVDPSYFMADRDEYENFKKSLHPTANTKALNSIIENVKSVLYENPEDLEWTQFTPLCDTAIYYFILDFEEYDADLVYDSDDEEEEEEELDFTGGFDFFEHCATIGVKLPQFDEALITYKG